MSYKAILLFTFIGIISSGCSLSHTKKNTLLALSKFNDPIFQQRSPKVAKGSPENKILEPDFAVSEELSRELKEAEALLSEPTIFINN